MNDLVLVQLPRTARSSLAAAFESVGVRVYLVDHCGTDDLPSPTTGHAVIAAVLRDPVDRLQSWFHSRLRAGRPFRPAMWTDWEAAFFTAIPSFDRFGEAMCATDEFLRSAAERGLSMWQDTAGTLTGAYGIAKRPAVEVAGTVADLPAAVERLSAMLGCATPLLQTDASLIDATPPTLPRQRSPLAEFGLRARLADEIERYEQLLGFVRD